MKRRSAGELACFWREIAFLVAMSLAASLMSGVTHAQTQGLPALRDPDVVAARQLLRTDPQQGVDMIRSLAEQGHPIAQYNLGMILQEGKVAPRAGAQGVEWLRKAADQGLADAQLAMGLAFNSGVDVEEDQAQAVAWYRKAAEQGNWPAQVNLGLAYWAGNGITRDAAEAAVWFRRAAEQGAGWGQYYLGRSLVFGAGVPKDAAQGAEWWRKAADQGYADAQHDLGVLYAQGRGVPRDYGRAVYWLAEAARSEHQQAIKHVKTIARLLPSVYLSDSAEVREEPDAAAAVLRTAGKGQRARELSRKDSWVEVYFDDRHTVGYVSAELLSRKK